MICFFSSRKKILIKGKFKFSGLFGYLWAGVFSLFKQLRRLEIGEPPAASEAAATATAAETAALTSGESQLPVPAWMSEDFLDDPPSYLLAVQVKFIPSSFIFFCYVLSPF
jgi:hypothetical protein